MIQRFSVIHLSTSDHLKDYGSTYLMIDSKLNNEHWIFCNGTNHLRKPKLLTRCSTTERIIREVIYADFAPTWFVCQSATSRRHVSDVNLRRNFISPTKGLTDVDVKRIWGNLRRFRQIWPYVGASVRSLVAWPPPSILVGFGRLEISGIQLWIGKWFDSKQDKNGKGTD